MEARAHRGRIPKLVLESGLVANLLLVPLMAPAHAVEPWTDITPPELALPVADFGVAWADYDADGDQDLCITRQTSLPNLQLFRNDGVGNFVETTAYPLTLIVPSRLTIWGDADNDGDLDFLRGHFIEQNALYRNDGAEFSIPNCDLCHKGDGGAAWGDYDQDGRIDVAFIRLSGVLFLFHNEGALHFSYADPQSPQGTIRAPIWIDADGDGDLDLHLVANGPDYLLRNDSGVLVEATPPGLADPDDGNTAAWGDYDNDGDADVYLPKLTGTNRLLRNDGALGFTDVTAGTPLGLAGDSPDASWVDFDNDGDLDLFVLRAIGSNVLFRNDAGHFVAQESSALDGVGTRQAAAWADFDGDGDLDLYIASDSTRSRLLRNDLGPSHWLQVGLVGTSSNRSGIGARIHAKYGGIWHMQDVTAGVGFSQGSLTVEFGLGPWSEVDSLVADWPSGLKQTQVDVPGNQRITMMEGTPTDVRDFAVSDLEIWPPVPNPMTVSTTLRLEIKRSIHLQVEVIDAQGRLVRTIAAQMFSPGQYELSWDGKDGNGRRVSHGVYWVRAVSDTERRFQRIVRLQ